MRQRLAFIYVMGKQICGEKKKDLHTTKSVKYGGGGVVAWACMAASGTGPLNIIDDLMYDYSSMMNLERLLGYKCCRKCHQTHQKALHIATGQ